MQPREFVGRSSFPAACSSAALLPAALVLAALSLGCRSGGSSAAGNPSAAGSSSSAAGGSADGVTGAAGAAGQEITSSVELTLDGVHELLSGGAQLQVRELNPVVNLAITTVFASNQDDLLQLTLALDGVQNAMGTHHSEFVDDANSAATAVAYLERVSYSSQSGTLDVTLKNDHTIDGLFDAVLAEDPTPGSAPALAAPRHADFAISGSFTGTWSLVCRSPVIGLPGDHSVADSPYCNKLAF